MNIHLISTGQVKITRNWREGKTGGLGRLGNALLDRQYTDWLPIYCAVIEHPAGLMVVDTGIPADANAPVYFPPFMPLVQRAAPFRVTAEDEIGAQMRQRGFDPADVRWVVLTHLHQDHDGGLHSFPNAEIVVSRGEWAAGRGLGGRMRGYFNWRWAGLEPRMIDFADGSYFSFGASERLADGVRLVPTPGHSAGHLSVVVEDGERAVFLAGDSAYTQELLLRDTVDGVGPDPAAQHDTHHRIVSFAAQVPTVYLPSHDPDSENRLAQGEPLPGFVASSVFA